MFGISITHFDGKAVKIAHAIAAITQQIENDLATGVVKTGAAYLGLEPERAALVLVCDTAIAACNLLLAAEQKRALKATLKGLGDDLTMLSQVKIKHDFAYYSACFQRVWSDFFSSKATPETKDAVTAAIAQEAQS